MRRHVGGPEEIAKTFAYIGVDWLPSNDYGIRAAAPFEVYHPAQGFTEAVVPLEPLRNTARKNDERFRVHRVHRSAAHEVFPVRSDPGEAAKFLDNIKESKKLSDGPIPWAPRSARPGSSAGRKPPRT